MKIRSVDLSIYLADKTTIGINIDGEQTAEAAIKILSAFTEPDAIDIPGPFTLADTEEIRAKLAGGAL